MVYYTYVLYSKKDKKFYIGYTTDLKQRFKGHRRGNTKSTKNRQGLNLIYFEGFINKRDAQRRERYFKTTQGKKGLRLILRKTLEHCRVV